MIQYKAGFKFVTSGVHGQVLDFPAAISWGTNLFEARRSLTAALVDAAEAAIESGQSLPIPNPLASDAEMDLEEPIYFHLHASSEIQELPTGVVT